MNNRYLYRAKTRSGLWVQGFLSCRDNKYYINNKAGMPFAYEVVEDTICQCTGLKDKNGNMVFENDVMSAHLDDYFPEDITYAMVIWGDAGYYLREKDSIDIQYLEEIDMKYFTVCGNIFDNPELIEQEG